METVPMSIPAMSPMRTLLTPRSPAISPYSECRKLQWEANKSDVVSSIDPKGGLYKHRYHTRGEALTRPQEQVTPRQR